MSKHHKSESFIWAPLTKVVCTVMYCKEQDKIVFLLCVNGSIIE